MSELRRAIAVLAEQFAISVLDALKSASLSELTDVASSTSRRGRVGRQRPATTAPTRTGLPRTRKGARRTKADQQKIVDAVLALLRQAKDGLRSEDIQKALGIGKRDLTLPMQLGLSNRSIKKKGIKRATRYLVA